jgi:hypothetical protein
MAGLKDKRGFIDKDRLGLSEWQAVEYWMKRWGVTREQITAAHRRAGRMVKDIAADLGRKRCSTDRAPWVRRATARGSSPAIDVERAPTSGPSERQSRGGAAIR